MVNIISNCGVIMEELNNKEDFQYIKERVKQRPLNRKKLMRRMIITASMAVIFGVLACFTILVLEPVFSNILYPSKKANVVEIPEDTDEILPEDMKLEEDTQPTIQVIERNTAVDPIKMYNDQYGDIYEIAKETVKSTVTLTSFTQDKDWIDNDYISKGTSSALYVANNGKELLFLTYTEKIINSEDIMVTFYDGYSAKGDLKQSDDNTGLSVVSVKVDDVVQTTLDKIKIASLANSRVSNLLATPVIAIGRPYGNAESVGYGMLVSKGSYVYLNDQNYEILTTDIYGSTKANGIIINMKGEVLGIIDQQYCSEDCANLITAIGISDLKKTIERMSNGEERTYLGIKGMDVSDEIMQSQGVPKGAYVTNIVMGSPAMNAGIQSGDVIVKIGSTDILKYSDLTDAISEFQPETSVTIVLKRQSGDEYRDIEVEVVLKSM